MLFAQLGLLQQQTSFERRRKRIIRVASALADLGTSIPVVAEQSELIADIQADEWWVDVTYPMLEDARKRLRNLVHLIEFGKKNILYSNFADEFGRAKKIWPPDTSEPGDKGEPKSDEDDEDGYMPAAIFYTGFGIAGSVPCYPLSMVLRQCIHAASGNVSAQNGNVWA